jgi:protein-L-isoaspartate(D-aspartate) O-methyltransferase
MGEPAANSTTAGLDRSVTAAVRRTMVDRQLRPFDVTDVPVLERFLEAPREAFLPSDLASLAYSDLAISLKDSAGRKSRVLQPPLVLARLLQAAEIRPESKVLDVAGGAGYSAALIAGLAASVVALESDPALAEAAKTNLAAIGAGNARVVLGPLDKGVADGAPYDVIIVHGAVEAHLDALFAQLTPNGRLLAIAKSDVDGGQQVTVFERLDGASAGERPLFDASAPVLDEFKKTVGFVF